MKETRALALLARIIGRRHGLEVEFSSLAQTASTDGKRITLPVVSNLGTEDHAILVEGLLDHEAMHCRFTDFNVALGKLEPLVASLTNVIEDVWGEREQGKIYPGCARNIRRAMDVMIRLGWYRGPVTGTLESPPSMTMNFLVNGLLARLYQSSVLEGFAAQYRAMLAGVLGEDLVRRIWEAACQVDRVCSTSEAVSLAEEIVELLRQAMPSEPAQPSAVDADQGGGSQPAPDLGHGDASKAGGSAQPGGPAEPGSGDTSPSNGPQASHGAPAAGAPGSASDGAESAGAESAPGMSGGGCAGGQPGQQPDATGADGEQRKGDAIRQILGASADQLASGDMGDRLLAALNGQGKAGKNAGATSHAAFNGRRPRGNAASGPGAGYPLAAPQHAESDAFRYRDYNRAAIAMSRGIEVKLGTKLEALLEAHTDSFVLHKRAGRRLEARRAPRIALGKLDVFRRVEEGTEVDTSVYFLIDCSESMFANFAGTVTNAAAIPFDETRIVAAAAVARAAAQVLDKHDVPFGVACFGGLHLPLKSFNARWPVARKLALTDCLGGTATDCAVMRIADDLVLRQEARKLVVLVTDGEPRDVPGTVAVMNEVRRLGIEFAVLFIGADGHKLQRLLQADGYTVARAQTRESLVSSFFEAVESAF